MLRHAETGSTFLLNSPYAENDVWDILPKKVQQQIIDKNINFYVINASKVAREAGLGTRVNTILQTCFFAISGILPKEQAIEKIKTAIKESYSGKGEAVISKNYAAVDQAVANLKMIQVPKQATGNI